MPFTCRVGNRHHREISRSIGTFAQVAAAIDPHHGQDLRSLQSELFRTYRSGHYDPRGVDDLLHGFGLVGYSNMGPSAPPFRLTINYIVGTPSGSDAPSEYGHGDGTDHEFVGLYLDAYVEFDYLSLLVDTCLVPEERASLLLRALEAEVLNE